MVRDAKVLSKTYEKITLQNELLIHEMTSLINTNKSKAPSARVEAILAENNDEKITEKCNDDDPESKKMDTQRRQTIINKQAVIIPTEDCPPVIKPEVDPTVLMAQLIDKIAKAEENEKFVHGTESGCDPPNDIGTTTMKPRSFLLQAIQRESDKVNHLKVENLELKQELEQYQRTLELIMSKYREQMLNLLRKSKDCCQSIMSQHESPNRLTIQSDNVQLSNQLQDMKNAYENTISPTSETLMLAQREELHQLMVEHETLVELYRLSKKYALNDVDIQN